METQSSNVKTQNLGFTLIEIMVGLTITALIFGSGYTAYRDFVRREALNGAYDELRVNLNLAKQRALSGEKPESCASATLAGYEIQFSNTSYSVVAVCDGNRISAREITLPEGIRVSGPTILYKVIGEGTNLEGDTTITLTQESTGETKDARISVEGILR